MKKQILSLVFITAFLLSLTLASAVISFTDIITGATLTQSDTSESFVIITNDLANFTYTPNGNLTITNSTSKNNVTSVTFTVTPAISIPLGSHEYIFSINATNSTNSADSISKNITITMTNNTNRLCTTDAGYLTVSDIEFDVLSGFGDGGDLFFYPLDEVEVTFNVENSGAYDISNIEITACLLDEESTKSNPCILDEEDMELSDDSFDLDSGDDVDITLTFEINPDDLKSGNNDYTLYVAATGDIDDSSADDTLDGDSTCSSDLEDSLDIRTTETFAVINNVFYTENLNCGEMLEISADVFNVGDSDLDNDEVYFEIYNKELGIDQEIIFDSGIDSMSQEAVSFSTKIPSNISVKAYNIRLAVLDDHHEIMQNKEDDESQETIIVTIGKCVITDTSSSVSITAELSEDTPKAVIGEQFIVESIIKNTGSSSVTYNVSVSGNEAWSEVSSIEPSTFTLASGESKEVIISFNVDSDAKAGDKDFTITTAYGSKTSTQKVAVTIEEGLSSSKIIQNIKDNSFVYTIVLVNLILLIAIIIVVVKMFGRKNED